MSGNRGSGSNSVCRKLYHTIAVWPHRLATTFGWDPAGLQDVSSLWSYDYGDYGLPFKIIDRNQTECRGLFLASGMCHGASWWEVTKITEITTCEMGLWAQVKSRSAQDYVLMFSLPRVAYFGGTSSIFLGSTCNSFGSTVPYIEQARNHGKMRAFSVSISTGYCKTKASTCLFELFDFERPHPLWVEILWGWALQGHSGQKTAF